MDEGMERERTVVESKTVYKKGVRGITRGTNLMCSLRVV